MDPYKVLGISSDATDEEVKKAYRELSRKYHPDANANNPLKDLAEEKFKEVQAAYSQIMDMRAKGYATNGSQTSGGYSAGYQGQGYQGQGYQGQNSDRVIIHISVVNIKVMVANMEEIHMRAMNVEQAICAAIFGVRIHFVNAWEEICVHVSKVWQG